MTDEERIERTTELLLSYVREANAWISGDQRVGEDTAAQLLDLAPATLKNWRSAGNVRPVSYGIGSRTTYRLRDLAEFIELMRES